MTVIDIDLARGGAGDDALGLLPSPADSAVHLHEVTIAAHAKGSCGLAMYLHPGHRIRSGCKFTILRFSRGRKRTATPVVEEILVRELLACLILNNQCNVVSWRASLGQRQPRLSVVDQGSGGRS